MQNDRKKSDSFFKLGTITSPHGFTNVQNKLQLKIHYGYLAVQLLAPVVSTVLQGFP